MGYVLFEYEGSQVQIPTIELGAGDVQIASIAHKTEKRAGIAFAIIEEGEVGRDIPVPNNATTLDINPVFQIESTSVESLLVLRDAIDKAIDHFDSFVEEEKE